MKPRTLRSLRNHRVWLRLSLGLALLPATRVVAAEPSWLAPSYQIVEITRAHYPHSYPAETYTDINPLPIGLGDNSQVVFHTAAPFGAAFGPRTWLWQPAAQFGRPAGTSLLSDDAYNPFYGTPPNLGGGAKGVTSDGRFGQLFPESQYERSLRWWNGSQWVTVLHETANQTRFRVPSVIHDVNDRGDIAFEYRMVDNFGLAGWTNTSRSGIWSGTMQNWLPLFPEDTTRAHVLAMNGNGVCVGVYRSATAPPGTAYRGFTATYGTTPMDFVPVGNLGGYSQTHDINDASEIVGVTGTQGGGVRPFIYLPTAAHGLAAGLHEIGPTMIGYTGSGGSPLPITARVFVNNRGQALLTPGLYNTPAATNAFLWQRGQRWPLSQLADTAAYINKNATGTTIPGNTPWNAYLFGCTDTGPTDCGNMAFHRPAGFNDKGEILLPALGADAVFSPQSWDDVIILLRPKISATLALEKDRLSPGMTNTVQLRLANAWNVTLPAPDTPVLHWDGEGAPEILSGPTLVTTNAWTAGATNEWLWKLRFTNETSGIFVAQASAATNNSTLAESALLKVLDQADLWVRRTNDTVWKGDDIYYEAPLPSQTREMAIQPTESASFQVRLQNDSERDRALTVRAEASGDPGWLATYKIGATDISALITNAGYSTATLATGEYVDFTVTLKGATNALDPQSRIAIVFTGKAVGGTNGSDTVEVAASVLNQIIVNSTGDEPDASLADGVPDVNTNAPGLQTTLRCAIDFANRREGADLIKFAIPANEGNWVDGVPQIEAESALPEITETLVIDGWTQSTNASTPPIVLSGKRLPRPPRPTSPLLYYKWPGAIPALVVSGEACEVRGLVINQFPTGVELAGAGSHVIEGCFFGLNAAGDKSLGNGVDGGGSLAALRDPNGYYQYYNHQEESGFELVPSILDYRYVNWSANYGTTGIDRKMLRARGWDLRVTSPQNRVGGETLRQRNRFGSVANFIEGVNANTEQGNHLVTLEYMEFPRMIWIDGAGAFANTILNSTFGVKVNERDLLTAVFGTQSFNYGAGVVRTNDYPYAFSSSIHITDAPGTMIGNASGGGNLFALEGVFLSGSKCVGTSFFGNHFGVTRDGTSVLTLDIGIHARDCGFVQIGGLNPGEGNRFAADLHDIELVGLSGSTSRILGNKFWSASLSDFQVSVANRAATEVRGNTFEYYHHRALWVGSYGGQSNIPPAGTVSVIDNNFSHNRGVVTTVGKAIHVADGRGHTIVGNTLIAPADERLIILEPETPGFFAGMFGATKQISPLPNDDFDLDGGPNNRQNWPVVATALLTNGQLLVQAGVDTGILSGQYQLHVYRSFSDQWHHGQPQELVASGFGTADASGRAAFIATVPAGPVMEGDFLCATATGPDGSTSEVGPVRRVVGGPDTEADGMGDATEDRVPNRAPAPLPGGPQPGPGFGDGNGDTVPDSQQAHVTSLPVAANQWLTLAAPAGSGFSLVDSVPLPVTNLPPARFTFPLGLIRFTLNGIAPGASVVVTNIFHGAVSFSNVFAYGPTTGNPQPHWSELNFTHAGDELRFTLTDGNTGDHDLVANGTITTLYALALPLPPEPKLTLVNHQAGPVTGIFVVDDGTNIVVTTNLVTLNRMAIAWPAIYTNLTVEYTDSLSLPVWKPTYDEAVFVGDQLVITNLTARSQRFYRLVAGAVRLFTPPAPPLTIQHTSTNTLVLSWPSWATDFGLQQNTNLVVGAWTSVTNPVTTNGSAHEVIIPHAGGSRFFRLQSSP